jgi:hypothetical protein
MLSMRTRCPRGSGARRLAARQAAERLAVQPPVELPRHVHVELGNVGDLPLPDNHVDLIVTSPPYGLGQDYHDLDDNEGYQLYVERVQQWAEELYRVTAINGRICLNVPLDISYRKTHPIYADWVLELLNAGYEYRTTIVWDEGNVSRSTAADAVNVPRTTPASTSFAVSWTTSSPGRGATTRRRGSPRRRHETPHRPRVDVDGGPGLGGAAGAADRARPGAFVASEPDNHPTWRTAARPRPSFRPRVLPGAASAATRAGAEARLTPEPETASPLPRQIRAVERLRVLAGPAAAPRAP